MCRVISSLCRVKVVSYIPRLFYERPRHERRKLDILHSRIKWPVIARDEVEIRFFESGRVVFGAKKMPPLAHDAVSRAPLDSYSLGSICVRGSSILRRWPLLLIPVMLLLYSNNFARLLPTGRVNSIQNEIGRRLAKSNVPGRGGGGKAEVQIPRRRHETPNCIYNI